MSGAPYRMLLVAATIAAVASVALNGCSGQKVESAQKTRRDVYASSIGGTVPASTLPGKVGQGYLVFSKWCSGCHAAGYEPTAKTPGGDKLPVISRVPLGTNLLQQHYQGAVPAALEERTDLTPEAIRTFVRSGLNAMPAFRKTEISDAELDALATYLTRNTHDSEPKK